MLSLDLGSSRSLSRESPGYANDIRRHANGMHYGVRTFKCDKCGKGFKTAGNMRAHVCRAHSGVKFRCARCGRASAQ